MMLYDKRWEAPVQPVKELEPWQKQILAAVDYIEEHGWCQGQNQDSLGQVCISGALHIASMAPQAIMESWLKLTHHVGYDDIPNGVASWNDEPGRTKKQVINMMWECVAKG